jgi:hypothetical protein
MRQNHVGLTLAGFVAVLLAACSSGGGGSSSSSSSGGGANSPPTANAGTAQSVTSGVTVTLNGSASNDSDGSIASYAWTQTAGGAITLSSTTTAQPTFTAPIVGAATTLTFSLVVTDNRGAASAASTVNVTVNPGVNTAPTANAGANQSAGAGVMVTLNGAASTDPDGVVAGYAWTQTAGTAVTLRNASSALATFIAPTTANATTLTFSLVVTDNRGASSTASTVEVTINPLAVGNAVVAGRITFARVRFATTSPFGLDYASPVQQPARFILVRAISSPGFADLGSTYTDSNGNYSLVVPGNTNMLVIAVARMQRAGGAPPHWNFRVQNGVAAANPYEYGDSMVFNSGAGTTHDLAIPTGISASGQPAGSARHSGPFAILDTINRAKEFVLMAAPTAEFPELLVDWGAQTQGTFFSNANPQRIALLADLTEDTDEFDQHVVAHEFGHYLEENFSRSDSIGGAHGVGDRLDIRVAFGEGFGYAFSAMVLDDPNARDSFFIGTAQDSSGFNIEDNPPALNDPEGCWCSESSVWSILYDLYDGNADTGDGLALGFAPLWQVLTGEQRGTAAFTSIFSFITALKAQQPASATAIDTLVSAQNIAAAAMDAFGTTETHQPGGVPGNAALPLYTTVTIGGGPFTLRSVDDAGRYNGLGTHRYFRFNVANTRNVTLTLATSNPDPNADPDFVVWRNGTLVSAGDDAPPGAETETFNAAPGTYVIDAYDCANGCTTEQGTPGDYDLTLTLN